MGILLSKKIEYVKTLQCDKCKAFVPIKSLSSIVELSCSPHNWYILDFDLDKQGGIALCPECVPDVIRFWHKYQPVKHSEMPLFEEH